MTEPPKNGVRMVVFFKRVPELSSDFFVVLSAVENSLFFECRSFLGLRTADIGSSHAMVLLTRLTNSTVAIACDEPTLKERS